MTANILFALLGFVLASGGGYLAMTYGLEAGSLAVLASTLVMGAFWVIYYTFFDN